MRLDRVAAAVAVGLLLGLAPAGAAQAATVAKDKPGRPSADERPGKPAAPDRPGKPAKPAKPAKGSGSADIQRTQTVFTCSYVCPADGSPCAWAVRAETRPLPVPAPVED